MQIKRSLAGVVDSMGCGGGQVGSIVIVSSIGTT